MKGLNGTLDTELVVVTPVIAGDWLDRNHNNRTVRKQHLAALAGAMSRGEWKTNGDAIRFAKNGTLLDGQHRLMACVISGVPFKTFVITGIDDDAFDTIDKGSKRTVSDTLHVRGNQYASLLAGTVTVLLRIGQHQESSNNSYSDIQIEQFIACAPRVMDSVAYCGPLKTHKMIRPSELCALHFMFSAKDKELADLFVSHISTGDEFSAPHVFHQLREKLRNNQVASKRLARGGVMIYSIKAWNAARAGKTVLLKHVVGEAFPKIK